MNPETHSTSSGQEKICQNCKNSFVIELEDFDFYKKIDVPPPTFCPECRLQRRLAWRNERSLYKDVCNLCGKPIVSMYFPDKPFPVYCRECWYSDKWNAIDYGRDYDWQKPFFVQYRELMEKVPRIALFLLRSESNVDYANFIVECKNIYLSYSAVYSENIYYSRYLDKSKEIFDCFNGKELEMCYENVDTARNFQTRFMVRSHDCLSSSFLFDCVNCQDCFMSSNLRNKQFVIRNKQYSKEKYEEEMGKINLGSHRTENDLKKEFEKMAVVSLHKFSNLIKTTHCTGDNIENSKNVQKSFDIYNGENMKFCVRVVSGARDVYDAVGGSSELIYDGMAAGWGSYNTRFYTYTDGTRNVCYADWCHNSSSLFGCVSLRKKDYCILNRQYTKDEYENMIPKIIEHMNAMPYVDTRGNAY